MSKPSASSLEIRLEALKIIAFCRQSGIKVQEALNRHLDASSLDANARAFCADLVYGYLRNHIRLDFIIGKFLKKPEKLPEAMLNMLALAIYSLFFQEKEAPYAIINETVSWIKKLFGEILAKVANGLLRNIQRNEQELKNKGWYISRSNSQLEALSAFYSVPYEVANLWDAAYGIENAEALMARSANRPWQGLRLNPGHKSFPLLQRYLKNLTNVEEIEGYGYAFQPGSLPEALNGQSLTFWISEGATSMQAPASMLIMKELDLSSLKAPVWDCCAGSGIKTNALLERNVNVRLASDISLQRLRNIAPFCKRLHLEKPCVAQASALAPAIRVWNGDIIADVPCSGLGVLGRRPDIRENISTREDIDKHVMLQNSILNVLSGYLEKGRRLVYITCTLNPEENDELIRRFIKDKPQFFIVREWQTPHTHPWLDGMYGAVIEKG